MMLKSRSLTLHGIIIAVKPLGERGKLITVFTREHGKILVKAPGARTLTSRFIGLLQPLTYATLRIYKSTKETYTLTDLSVNHRFPHLKNNLQKYHFGGSFLKLVRRMFYDEETPSDPAFLLIFHTLCAMEKTDAPADVFAAAQNSMLTLLGDRP